MIEVKNLTLSYGKNTILQNVSFSIEAGSINTIIGSNGCGKTTLLRALSKRMKPEAGKVLLNEQDIYSISNASLAKIVSILPQAPRVPSDYTVLELVSMGRTPHTGFMRRMGTDDYEIVNEALRQVNIAHLQHRNVQGLSGGERQRAWIAMCLAQQPQVLLLDEPTTFLDISYQYEIMRLITEMNREKGLTILMILHDLNQAIRYSDNILAICDGGIYAQGHPNSVINKQLLADVFHLDGEVIQDNVNDCEMIVVKD